MLELLRQTLRDFSQDRGTHQAAALSYYTVFSIPPLLMLLVTILGAVMDPQHVEELLASRVGAAMGPAGAELREIMQHAERPGAKRGIAGLVGVIALIFGATGAFLQLQSALNRIWEVKPDPEQGGVRRMLLKRVFSFGMLLTVGFLLIVSLVVSTLLQAFGDALGRVLPDPFSGVFLQALTFAVSLAVIALLFALIFKYMPDAEVNWADVRVGAVATALLFMAGKFALSLYLGRSDPGSAFGAAGSLALLLVWIYYSAIIVFIGAEFTQAWARAHGREIVPERGAVRVLEETRVVRPGQQPVRAGALAPAAADAKRRPGTTRSGIPIRPEVPPPAGSVLGNVVAALFINWWKGDVPRHRPRA